MAGASDPTFTFTIPSLHDDAALNCRVYHPFSTESQSKKSSQLNTRACILAHPYAPLGGCYDDPVVLCLVEELLRQHIIVGTFNFRFVHVYLRERLCKKLILILSQWGRDFQSPYFLDRKGGDTGLCFVRGSLAQLSSLH